MGERYTRWRWRRRGAWLWPAFTIAVVLDGLIGHLLPPAGESQHAIGAALLGAFFGLVAVILLSWPLGALVRRRRPDMPRVIARDYGGVLAIATVTCGLLAAGLVHRHVIEAHARARRDAIVQAQAFIGDRAPEPFRHDLATLDVYAITPGRMYRICVPDPGRLRAYCVIVDSRRPFGQAVSFAGYEPNSVFAQGAE